MFSVFLKDKLTDHMLITKASPITESKCDFPNFMFTEEKLKNNQNVSKENKNH